MTATSVDRIKQPAEVFGLVVNKNMSYSEYLEWFDEYTTLIEKDSYRKGFNNGVMHVFDYPK